MNTNLNKNGKSISYFVTIISITTIFLDISQLQLNFENNFTFL